MVEFALQSARAVMTGHGCTHIFCSFFKNCYLKEPVSRDGFALLTCMVSFRPK
jgi:hypothetical protein